MITAPGFDYADAKKRSSITLGQYVPVDANNPPPGVVTPITPALVRAQQQSRPNTVGPEVQRLFGEPAPYTIGPGDIIGIVVYDQPELLPQSGGGTGQSIDPTGISSASGFIVSADGLVSFPYVGRVKVAGLTEIDASEMFEKRLAKVFKNPKLRFVFSHFAAAALMLKVKCARRERRYLPTSP